MSHLYKFLVYNKINYSQHTVLIVDFWTYCSTFQLGVCTLRLQVIPSPQRREAALSLSPSPSPQHWAATLSLFFVFMSSLFKDSTENDSITILVFLLFHLIS